MKVCVVCGVVVARGFFLSCVRCLLQHFCDTSVGMPYM
jgi:hypothetical protein